MAREVTTAVIAAAGHATRMWPASKVLPKELFPVGKVPAIVHLLWEFLDAGIRRVILIVSERASGLVESLLDPSIRSPGNVADDPLVRRFEAMLAKLEFTTLRQTGTYGNGTPLILAADRVGMEPCIYAFGDDIVFGENITRGLISTYDRTGFPVLAAQQVEYSRRSSFGILECREEDGVQYIARLIEKPSPNETTSNLASLGRYLVTPDLLDTLRYIPPGRNNEVWFVDAIMRRIQDRQPVCAFTLTAGKWYTVGDPLSYAAAVKAATGCTSE